MNTSPLLSMGWLAFVLLVSGCTPDSPAPAASTSVAPAATSAPLGAVEVVSGVSIGPVAVGARREDVDSLGLPVRPHPSGQMGDAVRMVGPYYVVFNAGKVSSVAITPAAAGVSVRIGGRTLPPTASAAEIAAALPGCSAEVAGEGGSTRTCDGGKTLVKLGASCAELGPAGDCRRWDPSRPEPSVQVIVP